MMAMPSGIREQFTAWIGLAAEAMVVAIDRFGVKRRIELIETGPNSFTMRMTKQPSPEDFQFQLGDDDASLALPPDWQAALRGSQLDAVFMSSRFLVRPLDLPRRAAEFLDAMIRSQIDRLTPWSANEAVFGWTAPVKTSSERIDLTVVAAPKTKVDPLMRFAEHCGVRTVTLYAAPADAAAATYGRSATDGGIKVFEKRMRGALDVARTG